MNILFAQMRRDLALIWTSRDEAAVMLAFFLIIITLFPLAIGPDMSTLRPMALPVIWIAALLASLAGFSRIFAEDVRSGWVDQVALSPLPLSIYSLSKAVCHWLAGGLPMLLVTPVLALMLYVDLKSLAPLMLALSIGTMALTLLGVLAAALSEGARNGGSLMPMLVLPLAVPVLIFGTLASNPDDGRLLSPHMLLLMAVLAVLLAIVPVAAAAALAEAETDSS